MKMARGHSLVQPPAVLFGQLREVFFLLDNQLRHRLESVSILPRRPLQVARTPRGTAIAK